MKLDSWKRILFVIGLAFTLGGTLYAQDDSASFRESLLNHLLAPGPLIQGHAKFESDCLKCHTSGKGLPSAKCLDCHDQIKKQIKEKKSFHGLAKSACVRCHGDHKGRNFDSTAFNIKKFDHARTGFALKGKHAKVSCSDCHTEVRSEASARPGKIRYFAGTATCASCHRQDDVHFFEGGWAKKDCGACHGVDNWHKTINFDHRIDAHFPIVGKHADLKCATCHVLDHAQQASPAIGRVQYSWPDLKTKNCETCHKSPHLGPDAERFQGKCDQCHTAWTWRVSKLIADFNHQNTRFALKGTHLKLACRDCHTSKEGREVYRFESQAQEFCIDCHSNPHKGQFSESFAEQKCSLCHDSVKFEKPLPFDHDLTRYKLRDKHAKLACDNCHKLTAKRFTAEQLQVKVGRNRVQEAEPRLMHQFVFPSLAKKACTTCHLDVHAGQVGASCTKCHAETMWLQLHFSHDADSRFPLAGKHAELKCAQCHKVALDLAVPVATSQTIAVGPKVKPVIRYRPLPTQCVNCHKDPHAGRFGSRCMDCHSEFKWREIKDYHRDFTLTDVHNTLSCVECHKDNRPLKGQSQLCFMCHQKDDIHGGALPNCGECHRQDLWDHTSFRHSMTYFPLQGVHRTLQCVQCHSGNIYRGTPDQCINCHLAAAKGVTNPVHVMPSFTNCKSCHNQFVF